MSAVGMGLALAAALTLHVALLAGWQQDPGHSLQPAFVENLGDECDCILPLGLGALYARGEATVRCDVDRRGQMRNCRWIRESGTGYGDAAVVLVRQWDGIADPKLRGRRGVDFDVCVGNCPIS